MLRFVMARAGVLAVTGLAFVMTACGPAATNQSGAPTAAPTPRAASAVLTSQPAAAATTLPTAQATAAAQPNQASGQATAQAGAAAQPNQAQPNVTAAAGQAPAQAQGASQAATTTLVIDSSASKASYRAHEQLVGRTLPSDAVGTSSSVSGSLVLAPDGSIVGDQSKISVDLSKLQSDESRRDNFIKGTTLQTSRFPMATFVPREAQGLPSPLPTTGQATFQLIGDLTVHGVTRPVTWQVTAQFGDGSVSGAASTTVNISDFGMSPPKAGPVLSIEDGLTLELAFTAARQA
jgi:polyisoprenoid-binding protein YceI